MIKKCIDCKEDFEARDKQQFRCSSCQELHRTGYSKGYNKNYRMHKPPSAISGQYYEFYRFAETMTDDEIRFLISRRRKMIKNRDMELNKARTHIKILTDIYKLRQEKREEERINNYEST